MNIELVARCCHAVNKALCEAFGDRTQSCWEDAEPWQRNSAIRCVQFRLQNPDAPESAQHDAWMADKLEDGWTYGPIKDADKKEHPCLVSFEQLPPEQRAKDAVFCAVVDELLRDQAQAALLPASVHVECGPVRIENASGMFYDTKIKVDGIDRCVTHFKLEGEVGKPITLTTSEHAMKFATRD